MNKIEAATPLPMVSHDSPDGAMNGMNGASPDLSPCCGGVRSLVAWSLAVMGGVTVVAIAAAVYFAGVASEARNSAAQNSAVTEAIPGWSGLPLANATAAVSSEKFSLSTGAVSEQAEGLYVLDHNSGLLQCSVMYPRMGQFLATFTTNVADGLGSNAKGGSYIMVTGTADFPRSSNNPVGMSIIYVLDTATGNYAAYAVPFNAQAMNANRPQQGMLVMIGQGTANPVIDRDALR